MSVSLRLRLALWYGALMAVAMTVFAGVVYLVVDRTLDRTFDSHLRSRAEHIAQAALVRNGRPTLPGGEEQTDDPSAPAVVFNSAGHVTAGEESTPVARWLGRNPVGKLRAGGIQREDDAAFSTQPIVRHGAVVGYALVWQPLRGLDDARATLLLALLLVCPLLVVAAMGGGMLIAGRALRPVTRIADLASSISVTDLHRRVEPGNHNDELGTLAAAFNTMIARLENAVGRERRFTADASHELRAPLSVIQAEAGLALDRERTADDYRRALGVIEQQVSTMEEMLSAMLALARTEALAGSERDTVAVADIVALAMAQLGREETRPGVRIETDIDPDLAVTGSSLLLTQAVRNLFQNASAVTPAGKAIAVSARQDGRMTQIDVIDSGPGVPDDHTAHIFEPFFQVSDARTPGHSHGLGLTIVARIVEAHGGSVEVFRARTGGACFRISLPAAQAPKDVSPGVPLSVS